MPDPFANTTHWMEAWNCPSKFHASSWSASFGSLWNPQEPFTPWPPCWSFLPHLLSGPHISQRVWKDKINKERGWMWEGKRKEGGEQTQNLRGCLPVRAEHHSQPDAALDLEGAHWGASELCQQLARAGPEFPVSQRLGPHLWPGATRLPRDGRNHTPPTWATTPAASV